MTQGGISHLEVYRRQGRYLQPQSLVKLLEITGLPVEALSQPEQFVREHPDFLKTCKAPPAATS
jgi:hypothetical protein